jgi:hypothetical protein
MRLSLEILSLVVLVFLGLSTPYRDYVNQYVTTQVTPSRVAKLKAAGGTITPERIAQHQARLAGAPAPDSQAATPAARDSSWMWHRNALDQPLKNQSHR